MKRALVIMLLTVLVPIKAPADLWGGDLPLLTQIVFNTLQTLYELRRQTGIMDDAMDGIKDKIDRIQTIATVVQPSNWNEWKDPREAARRIQLIYYTLPKEYRTDKSDEIESEMAKAMNLVSRLVPEANTTFLSGKELERKGADASPGVAAKLTASGVGTLVAMEAQSQVIQSHVTSLLTQMLASANEKESRSLATRGSAFGGVSPNLGGEKGWFSNHVTPFRWLP